MLGACDGAILTGGSSVGTRDLVPRVMSGLGSPGVVVHGIRLRPGKPTMLAAAAVGVIQAAHTRWFLEGGDLTTIISDSLEVLETGVGRADAW